jgi:16S rRNA (uracil1498-N3)-methyltransferase
MRLHRFYIPETIGSRTEITIDSAELSNQLRRVFRLTSGDSIIVFDGSGLDYECDIIGFETMSVTIRSIRSSRSRTMPNRDVILYASITKKDTFEWIVEKATELGVTRIVPLMAERSEKKNLNMERLNKIAIEASEQSGRGTVPVIGDIQEIVNFFDDSAYEAGKGHAIVFHTEGESYSSACISAKIQFKSVSPDNAPPPLSVFIGPEGGWSPREVAMFHNHKIPVVTLGTQVLRAETAVIAALSKVLLG